MVKVLPNGGGFTKMLFRRRFTHFAMAIPFIFPCYCFGFSGMMFSRVLYYIVNFDIFAIVDTSSSHNNIVLSNKCVIHSVDLGPYQC